MAKSQNLVVLRTGNVGFRKQLEKPVRGAQNLGHEKYRSVC